MGSQVTTIVVVCWALICGWVGIASAADPYLKESQSQSYLGIAFLADVCYVDGRQDDVRAALEKAWSRAAVAAKIVDGNDPRSDVSLLNAANGAEIQLREEMRKLLSKALDLSMKTVGAFDVTSGPLTGLWRRAAEDGMVPGLGEIMVAKEFVGSDKIRLSENGKVSLLMPGVKVDLGSAAAGFVLDEMAKILRAENLYNFRLIAGGIIVTAGESCQGGAWRVAVKDPSRQERALDTIEVGNGALASLVDPSKDFWVQDRRWSSIISPLSGYPETGVIGSTILAPTAFEAAALSLAVAVLGPAEGRAMIGEMGEGYEAMVLFQRDQGELEWHATSGYEDRRLNIEE